MSPDRTTKNQIDYVVIDSRRNIAQQILKAVEASEGY